MAEGLRYKKKYIFSYGIAPGGTGGEGVVFFDYEYKRSINGPHSPLGNCFNTLGIPLFVNRIHLSGNILFAVLK